MACGHRPGMQYNPITDLIFMLHGVEMWLEWVYFQEDLAFIYVTEAGFDGDKNVEAQLRLTGLVGSYARRPVSKNCILRSCKCLPMHTDQSVRTGVHWCTSYATYTTSEYA